ncbi:mitochondrial carrier domain-containing protein [Apiosordaria backusii]|uniref:Mitochondrial carrier domain-containing protein n=1 Tax=Apiosordaria backusii TaxID=314023 RepID=A0AA40DUX6_9PEZI|nr:mitochondrial carrier domain-containing protein [Apiosordaria backusii]
MSADFWAGYLSGACSIIIGNPLDVLKVRLQASSSSPPSPSVLPSPTPSPSTPLTLTRPRQQQPWHKTFLLGTAAPILSYGALNALLFVSYNRSESFLNSIYPYPSPAPSQPPPGQSQGGGKGSNLTTTFIAGCISGIATFLVSCPTEIIKVRSQTTSSSSWSIAKSILRTSGIKGLYEAGGVTVVRDSLGYGFYFWGYELSSRLYNGYFGSSSGKNETGRALLCGGVAGVLTWASIFPLDVVKTRMQTQGQRQQQVPERQGLLTAEGKRKGAWQTGKEIYTREGIKPFFRGLGVCSLRAFVVNAVQFGVYEWVMMELGEGRAKSSTALEEAIMG